MFNRLYTISLFATNEGDLIFDPFGGSGTTYIAAEILKRHWIGIEIGSGIIVAIIVFAFEVTIATFVGVGIVLGEIVSALTS